MVVFKDNPEKYNTPEMFLKLQEDITKVMDLHKQITQKEESIMLNPTVSFVKKYIFLKFVINLKNCSVREEMLWKPRRRNGQLPAKIIFRVGYLIKSS